MNARRRINWAFLAASIVYAVAVWRQDGLLGVVGIVLLGVGMITVGSWWLRRKDRAAKSGNDGNESR